MLRVADIPKPLLPELVARYALQFIRVADAAPIPHSFWGAPEAGISSHRLFARADTPVHSVLHELAHLVCMTTQRRFALQTNAGGDANEECAVCYLQVVLADHIGGFGRARAFADMDSWGYSFREGSARAWFLGDGLSAQQWLLSNALLHPSLQPTWRLRD